MLTPYRRIAACFVVAATASIVAERLDAQPLEAELAGLVSSHPEIQAQQATVEATRREIDRALSNYYPQVDFDGNIGPTRVQTEQRRRFRQEPFEETQKVARLTITQNLFDGFETPANVRVARMNTEVARYTLEGTRQEVLLDGIEAYLAVLRRGQLVRLAEENVESIRLQADLEDERVERGAGIEVDVLQAKARLQIAKERLVAFQGALQDAVSDYIQVFDHAPDIADLVDPTPPAPLLPRTVDEAVDVAIHENPAVGSSLSTVEVAAERRRLARAGYFPRLDIVSSADYEDDFDLREGVRTDFSVLLQATWTLFNGFRTSATVEQAAYDYRSSQENHEAVTRDVVQRTRLAWQQLDTALEREELLDNAVVIAEEALVARRRLREEGLETVINVLLAEDEVNTARINLTEARYDALVAVYAILRAMGRLTPDVLGLRTP